MMRAPPMETLAMLEVELFAQAVARAYGVDVGRLPRASMETAAQALVQRSGVRSVAALIDRVLHDPEFGRIAAGELSCAAARAADEAFEAVFVERLVPWLRTFPYNNIWVAGCGNGAAVCRLAILLSEAGLYERTTIHATEPDAARLMRARRGAIPTTSLGDWRGGAGEGDRAIEQSGYVDIHGDMAIMRAALMRNIVWSHYDLAQGYSFNEFNLIVCRGVLDRMPPLARRHALQLFRDSLPLRGVLALGQDEQPEPSPAPRCFRQWGERTGLYQRMC